MNRLLISIALFSVLTIPALSQTGKITGKLTYPSDYIPPKMILCVEKSIGSMNVFCSNDTASRLRRAKIKFYLNHNAASYQIRLPAGKYFIFATFPDGKAPTGDMEGVKAYYNEFVKCGMSVECKSKKPIALVVRSGRSVRGITVGDWY